MNLNVMSLNKTNRNNSLIDYKNWRVANSSGVMRIKDNSRKRYNATSYFGQGCYFDGVSQRVDINGASAGVQTFIATFSISAITINPIFARGADYRGIDPVGLTHLSIYLHNSTIYFTWKTPLVTNKMYTLCVVRDTAETRTYLDGVHQNTTASEMGNSLIDSIGKRGSSYFNGQLKDMFIFNRVLTEAEIMKAYMYPNEFYMDAKADSLCILNMPMCEKDGYVRNYKTYTEVQKEYSDFNDGTTKGFTALYDATVANVGNKLKVTAVVNNPYTGKQYTAIVGNYYRIRCKMLKSAGSASIIVGSTGGLSVSDLGSASISTNNAEQELIIICKATTTVLQCNARGISMVAGDYFTIDDWEVTDLGTSIYPIVNFTTACRTSAQRLTAGLQTSGFKRDTSGTILGKSNYLECDGVGYADTGFIVDTTKDFTIEYIYNYIHDGTFSSSGTGNNVIKMGNQSNLGVLVFEINGTQYPHSVYASNTPYYMTVSKTSGIVSTYINGVLKNTINVTLNTMNSLNVGKTDDGAINNNNDIRLFKVHKKALTASQVLANYNKYVAKGLLA